MRHILFTLFILLSNLSYSQEFYDLNTIQKIEITFSENNWDQLLDAEYASTGDYIMAQSVAINGVVYDSVGVKYKGNSTYRSTQVKNPFHIELDTYKDHKHEAYTDIKLSNVAKDPSFLREVLSYQVLRQYMEAPLSNFANVYVNGNLLGLYTNSEAVSKKFLKSHFYSKNNTFVKCNPPAGAGPQSNDFPNLVYLGQDSTDYYDAYELKSDDGWSDLLDLCDTLNNSIDNIEEILDVDKALWMIAFNNVLVNLDSYSGRFAQNYYLYKDDYNRFLSVVWDLNESFGKFSDNGTDNLRDTEDKQQMSHLLHENNSDFPLIQKLMSVPMYKRMYLAHVKTMLLENFNDDSLLTTGQSLQNLIDTDVQADNNKFFTYNNFISNLTSDINAGGGGPGGGSTNGITNLMSGRADYLLAQSDFTKTEPSISNITESNLDPTVNSTTHITASITDAQTVFLAYRSKIDGPFTKNVMFDDGAHNDGAANDGIYGRELSLKASLTQYYIYAENEDIGKFSPVRAEHEFHIINAGAAPVGDLAINEFMASNEETMADQDGEFDDWIELYNNGTSSISLDGYFLSDDADELTKWPFPNEIEIAPDSYLIIWADNDEDQAGLHASFKLSSGGETLYLIDNTGTIIDEVTYVDQSNDISYSRIPNGKGDFQNSNPTFNSNNDNGIGCDNNGGDADGDGICADVDCDDNNADIAGQEEIGTSCDDGNDATINDVIQSDGCSCAGYILMPEDLVINELMAANSTTVADQDGEFEDWIELYNNGTQAIDLTGYALSDNGGNLTKWIFPDGITIAPSGYLVLWADDDEDQAGLHTNFKLSASDETLFLIDPSGNIIDYTSYEDQTEDISYGRFPNGTGDFRNMVPTFNAMNSDMSSNENIERLSKSIVVFPNPVQNNITITSTEEISEIILYNLTGQKVKEYTPKSNLSPLDLGLIPNGIYIIHALTKNKNLFSQKIVIQK